MIIQKIEAWPVRLPRDFGKATGGAGTPTKLVGGAGDYRWSEVYPALYSVNYETALVRVTMSNGLVGWGEAQAPLAPEVACEIIRLLLAPALKGQEFDGSRAALEWSWERMYSTMRVRGQTGGFMLDAISGVDIALWDIAGKIAQKPIAAMVAESPAWRLPAYVSGLPAVGRREAAIGYRDVGFTRFKLFYDTPEVPAFLESIDTMPEGTAYAVDALWRFDLPDATRFGKELDQRGALWFEAPLHPESPAEHSKLAKRLKTPVAIGESYRTRFEMAPFFRERALRVYQPELGPCGITEGLRLAAMATDAKTDVVPHLSIACGPQIAAALQFAAAVHCHVVEYNPQVLTIANRFLHAPLRVEGDTYVVPQEPGLGIHMNEAALP